MNARVYDPKNQPDYQIAEFDGGRLCIKAFRQDGSMLDDKAYADIRVVAVNILKDKTQKVSIDVLNTMGYANHYDQVYNMVFIET